jgi:hypothetical protein
MMNMEKSSQVEVQGNPGFSPGNYYRIMTMKHIKKVN